MKYTIYEKIFYIIIIILICAYILTHFDNTHFNGLDKKNDEDFKHRFFNRIYFLFTTFSGVGYGDVTPASNYIRFFVMCFQFILIISIIMTIDSYFIICNKN